MKKMVTTSNGKGIVLLVLFCATACLTASAAVNGAGADITAFVREHGAYTVEAGSYTGGLNSNSLANIFDGITNTTDEARALLHNTQNPSSTTSTPVRVLYNISDSSLPGYEFEVTSFTMYRVTGTDAIKRSATEFKLEGWDGSEWQTLFETSTATVWDWGIYARTYTIPASNRGRYRKYLFTVTNNGGDPWWTGMQELVFNGNITQKLVWNGAEGARWNATDANWLDGTGAACAWQPGAKAILGERGSTLIAVEGTNEVGGIVFSPTNTCTIAGGTLALTYPAEILAGNGDVIASEMTDAAPADVYKGYLDENKTQPELFPADPGNKYQGSWILLWRNRKLSGITGFTDAAILQNTDNRAAQAYHYMNDGETASVQFQHLLANGGALLGAKLLLAQVGADVYGRIEYAKYSYANPRALGDNLDATGGDIYAITVKDGVVSTSGYGLFGVKPVGGELSGEPLAVSVGEGTAYVSPLGARYLPKNASNPKTGDAVLCFPNSRVEDLSAISISSGTLNYNGGFVAATVHYFTNNATNATVQVQGNAYGSDGNGARLCVKIEFTDGVGGVYARAVYAKYDWDNKRLHDFDSVSNEANIYDETYTSGAAYGVNNLVGVFKGHRVTFGASALTIDREITGDGTVRFAPLSGSQTVTVPVARTLGKVAFGGATTFAFGSGASLSVGSAEIEDVSAVNVSDANLLRIGTTKCMSKEQQAHFMVNGALATQDDQGWIIAKPGMVIILR